MHELFLLGAGAAAVGAVHAAAGPDHYLPFVALARARRWSAGRAAAVTLACGAGHVAASLVLAAAAAALGWSLGGVERVAAWSGSAAGWLLVGGGLAYLAWGLRRARRARPHAHWHHHADGTLHCHEHQHLGAHAHLHEARPGGRGGRWATWALFLALVLGPCEPLVPLLMLPAAARHGAGLAVVAIAFAAATLGVMTGLVLLGRAGGARLPRGAWCRWDHAAAGLVLILCGLAVFAGL